MIIMLENALAQIGKTETKPSVKIPKDKLIAVLDAVVGMEASGRITPLQAYWKIKALLQAKDNLQLPRSSK